MGGAHSRSTDPTQRLKNSHASLPRADEARANENSRDAGYRQGLLGQQATGNAYQAMSQFRSPGVTQRQDGVGGGLNLNVNVGVGASAHQSKGPATPWSQRAHIDFLKSYSGPTPNVGSGYP